MIGAMGRQRGPGREIGKEARQNRRWKAAPRRLRAVYVRLPYAGYQAALPCTTIAGWRPRTRTPFALCQGWGDKKFALMFSSRFMRVVCWDRHCFCPFHKGFLQFRLRSAVRTVLQGASCH